ncbi:ABC transporter ATP-binding protein [Actinoplanes regularis]|uniref:ABC-type nitrate/sulfonate/bicarbonate transport system, ATPase component n=1 Tax=Actinoplanes regularis TaxID=52697 RepID=A0A238WAQ9_9ACTN|nr:ABC transporter ATP-binding protein [Actinoplanes regularis]GIE85164.1 ABC transporter ATP-binding protein [Actinoplanes regularis]GLW27353.1 ABC transporter ATP-binding protein [Actinoplanes regularis]SNR42789.1 ABC-type nitrate/sulfonate/bicarbonate transport system, ATPase component [Actinoplanes regularis]
MPETLRVTGLDHHFGDLQVLKELEISVGRGEFVSIVGPSGSGKSTLLQLIGGLLEPTAGGIEINGADAIGRRGLIGYMPQQPALMPWRTVEANVVLAREIAGGSKRDSLARAREWLARVGLEGFARSYPHQLSGGMRQRVAFLRALISDQELLCLDEPFSALDAMTRADMHRWLLDLWEANRRAVLFVTHNIEEALLLSDTVYAFSHRPATVLERISVPFGRPRRAEVTDDPEFIKLRRHLTDLLTGTPAAPR